MSRSARLSHHWLSSLLLISSMLAAQNETPKKMRPLVMSRAANPLI